MSVKLYVGNLPFRVTEEEITELFSQAGTVLSVQIILDKMTGRPRGFGFVEMDSPQDAQSAIAKFHSNDFGGRALTVNEARPLEARPPRDRDRGDFRGRDRDARR